MTGWIIFGCIVLFFVFLFTVHAFITLEMAADDPDGMKLSVRVLFIKLKILPKKEKSYNLKNYTLKKIRKRDAKAAEKAAKAAVKKKEKAEVKAKKKAEKKAKLAAMTKAERKALKAKKKASRPALTDLIPLVCRVLGLFVSRFFGKLRIKVAKLHVRVGAADAMQAALMYGVANQAVQYLFCFLQKITNVDGLQNADFRVEPDFLSDKIEFDFCLTIRVSMGNVLGALFKAGWKFLVGFIRIKPNPKDAEARAVPKPPKIPAPEAVPAPDERA